MTMADTVITQRCSQRARVDGVLPVGTIGVGDRSVFVQVEPPWPSRVEDDPRLASHLSGETGTVTRAIWPVVPGPSQERTSLLYVRPNGPCERLDGFDHDQAIPSRVRDILVCTHGTRDTCCGTVGMKLVASLTAWAAGRPDVRLWRTSHLGGHRFAPTLLDLPTGDGWAFVDPAVALELLEGDPSPERVRRHHRGWLGLASAFEQAAESAAWAEIGPLWRTGARSGRTEGVAGGGDLVTVTLRAKTAAESVTTVRAQVQRSMRLQVVSCGTEAEEAEYRVIDLEVEA
jgi:hypothetical protein